MGTVKLKGGDQHGHAPLSLIQLAGAQSHSTVAWLLFSVRVMVGRNIVVWIVEETGDWIVNGDETQEMSG